MSDAGWFDDPSGRFGKRWFDGTKWSDHVVLANGTTSTDALPESETPFPPPAAAPPPLPPPPPPGFGPPPVGYGSTPPGGYGSTPPVGYGSTPSQGGPFPVQPGYGPPPGAPYGPPGIGGPRDRYAPGAGLAVAGVGVILILLSVFVLNWTSQDGQTGKLSDFHDRVSDASSLDVDGFALNVTVQYGLWAAYALFGLTLVLAILAGIPVPTNSTGNTLWRLIGAVVAGLAAIGHTIAMLQLTKGDIDPEIGAWLGTIGYFVVIVGLILGARRVGPRPQPYGAPPSFAGAPR